MFALTLRQAYAYALRGYGAQAELKALPACPEEPDVAFSEDGCLEGSKDLNGTHFVQIILGN